MIDLKTLFPKASKSFLGANPQSPPSVHTSDAVAANVAPRRGKMNGGEAEFAMRLEAMKRAGEILRYEFEGVTLRFAGVRYTPDFVVFGHIDDPAAANFGAPFVKLIEVKGPFIKGNRERAVERFRHARTYYPEFSFEMWQRQKGGEWNQII